MGIKQLTTYVRDHINILYTDEFSLAGHKLVFDGGALYYALLRNRNSDTRFGGDYSDIYNDFKSYFTQLKEIGVIPYIVLDGGSNIPIKNGTIRERFDRDVKALRNVSDMKRSSSNFPKPVLLKSVFIEVLIEMQINFVLAKGEADMLVAALANRLSCPVVTGDSDFFVVMVNHGVLPMDALLMSKTSTTKCVRYRAANLARHLKVHENLLPMIAVMMGSDYSDDVILHKIQMHCGAKNSNGSLFDVNVRVKNIGEYISRFRTLEDVVSNLSKGDDELRTHMRSVLREFDLKQYENEANELFPILNKVFSVSEKTTPIVNPKVPTEMYLKHLVYHGLANPCVLDIYFHKTHFIRPQCEDIARRSCSESAEKLRTYLYILLLYQKVIKDLTVSEFKRSGDGYKETGIQVSVPEWTRVFPVDIVNGVYKTSDKVVIFCDLTRFPIECLKSIQDDDRLFMISVRYWIQQSADAGCTLKLENVEALLLCYIQLKSGNRKLSRCSYLDNVTAHHYSRWQSIMFYLVLLNTIFRYPFVSPLLSKVYHGNHVHQLFHLLDEGADKESILVSTADKDMFDDYMNVLTMNATSCLIYKQSRKRSRDEERPALQQPPLQRPPMQHYGGNPFAPFGR